MKRMIPAALLGLAIGMASVPAVAAPDTNPAAAAAGLYKLDTRHASLTARIMHLGFSNYTFRFNTLDASFQYDPAKPEASKVTVSVDPASIDTGSTTFNQELAGERFLNVAKHPTMTFTSTKITRAAGNKGQMTGDLTFLGVTKPVTLDVTYYGAGVAMGATKMGFSATGSIKRSDFGFMTMMGPLGDQVDLQIEAEFVKQ